MFGDAVNFLLSLSFGQAIAVFWYFFIFDLPRYTISAISLIIVDITDFIYKGNLKNNSGSKIDESTPVSLLLVGHNEGKKLYHCIMSVLEQKLNNIEIIVVDDGSTDNTAVIGEELYNKGLINAFLQTGLRGGKAAALNYGFRRCTRSIVISADIDTTFDRDAFNYIIFPFFNDKIGAVSGNIGVRNHKNSLLASIQYIQYLISISLGRKFLTHIDALAIVPGGFGAFRKQAVESVGGWDVGPGDDSALTAKLRLAGWKIGFAQHAWALTDVPSKLQGFINQQMRWNRSVVRNRLRIFKNILNPAYGQFNFSNVVSTVNILFFQVFLSWSFFLYQIWLFYMFGLNAFVFIIAISILYMFEDFLVYTYIVIKFPEREKQWLYLPLFAPFKSYFLRGIRAIAYIDEIIFRHSYKDEFYPSKVRKQVHRY